MVLECMHFQESRFIVPLSSLDRLVTSQGIGKVKIDSSDELDECDVTGSTS